MAETEGGAEVEDLFMCTFFQQKTGAPAGRVAVKNCTLSNISGHTKTWVFGLTPAAGSTFKANKQYLFASDTEVAKTQWMEDLKQAQQGALGTGGVIKDDGSAAAGAPRPAAPAGGPLPSSAPPPGGSSCKRCSKTIVGTVVKIAEDKKYHPHCFICKRCNADCLKGYQLFEEDAHCPACVQHIVNTRALEGAPTGVPGVGPQVARKWPKCTKCQADCKPGFEMGGNRYCDACAKAWDKGSCERCQGIISGNHLQIGRGDKYHRECFTCKECERPLREVGYRKVKLEVYCLECAPHEDKIMYREDKKDFSTKMDWNAAAKISRTDFGAKLKQEASNKHCLVADCQSAQIPGKNYCTAHQNSSFQGTGTVKAQSDSVPSQAADTSSPSTAQASTSKFCPECGQKGFAGKFCGNCGTKIPMG